MPKTRSTAASDPALQKGCPKLVGYARISTLDQNPALQLDALKAANVDVLLEEARSGADRQRPVLAEALASLSAGDTLVIWQLSRLGRSTRHLLEIAEDLRDRGVHLRSLKEGFDTNTAAGRLLYAVLAAVAEFERELTIERTVAGMKAAKDRGKHVGRPRRLAGTRLAEALRMLEAGKSQAETAHLLAVSRATLQRSIAGRAA